MTPSTAIRTNPAATGREAPTGADRAQDHDRDTSVGARLRRAREARGIALRDLAESTKLSVSALEAIERDDLKRLPGGIFTRAFVRTYAEAVGLHPDRTLEAFLAQAPETAIETGALRAPEVPSEIPADPAAGPVWRAITTLAVPTLVIVLYVVLRPASEEPTVRFDRRPLSADRVHALAIDTPAPVAHTPAVWTDSGLVHAVNQAGGLEVTLAPRSACWIAATLDGTPRISRLLAAGEQITLEAEREIVLKLGDAGAVSITVNGEPIRMLGKSGQVVTARIAQDNVGEYLATN